MKGSISFLIRKCQGVQKRVGSVRGGVWIGLLILLFSVDPSAAQTKGDVGEWKTLPYLMPINPIHVGLLHTGKVLVVAGSEGEKPKHDAGISRAAVWDLQNGTITVQNLLWDLFCNGMSFLPDGRALIVGGSVQYDPFYGEARASIFDPITKKFVQVQSMKHGRWYATTTALNDGRILTFSGHNETGGTNTAVEIYKVAADWSPESLAPWTPPLYPWLHLLPSGELFYSGLTPSSHFFNPATLTWTLGVAHTNYGQNRDFGSSVLLPLLPENNYTPRVMILGGHDPATATTEVIDLSSATPSWKVTPPMSGARIQMNAVLLPNGKLLALGGSGVNESASTAVLAADLFDPIAETWSSAGVATYARLYHSVALLLPDATVAVAGSNPVRGTYEPHIEIYSPAYLFTTDGAGQAIPAVRPTITDATARIGYGSPFQVQAPDAGTIASVVLMRPGSSTHASDMEQRMIGLSFSPDPTNPTGALTVTGPPDGNIAPPGYYMLFILNQSGVPSVARFVQLSPTPTNQPPVGTIVSPAADVTIEAGESVTFSGTATDPDGTLPAYSWIFPEGTPNSSASLNPGTVTFSTPGTYVVSLTVVDKLGANDPSPPTRTITVVKVPLVAPLVVSFLSPAANSTVTRKVQVTVGMAGAVGSSNTFTLSVDSKVIGTKTVSGTTAKFQWNTRGSLNGPHTLTATVKDASGNTGMASETVTVKK